MKPFALSCVVALSLATLMGCEKKEEAPAPTGDAPAAQAPSVAAAAPEKAPSAAPLDMEKIPVEEQFESEVEAEITPANFEQQIDSLEKELKAE
jgi:hypothetical protein